MIDIAEGSFVHDVFEAPSAVVNSYHSWQIGRLAPEQSFHTGDPIEHKFIENFLKRCEECRFGG